jgi:uncharacterized protein DUF4437
MARPWIEFVQSQHLAWQRGALDSVRKGAEVKVLSADTETGASSLLVRYPAGFAAAGAALAVDDEFLVLEGALHIGDRSYPELTFAHLPAGFKTGAWSSREGAIVLQFFSGAPVRAAQPFAYDERRLVLHKSAFNVPYTGNFHPEFPPGAGRKMLYQDPQTRDASWLLGTLPLRWAERSEVHPTVEEMYLLGGEVHGNRGVMRPGAYFWRPPSVPHGPYGTQTGNLYLFRTKGGDLSTTYVEPARPFRWWPEYDAVLPPELEAARGEVPSSAKRW